MRSSVRLPARFTNYRYRYLCLSARDTISLKDLMQDMNYLEQKMTELTNEHLQIPLQFFILYREYLEIYKAIVLLPPAEIPRHVRTPHVARTIDSFSGNECPWRFRFLRGDLYRLLRCLDLENKIIALSNGSKFTGEEILLFSLHRYAFPSRLEELSRNVFGKEFTQWSRVFTWFNVYIISRFGLLLTNGLSYWKPYFPTFSNSIQRKMEEIREQPYEGTLVLCGFYDCTVIGTCRPGGGPTEPGVDAPRYNTYIQMAFYNGWKKHHGIKFLSTEFPNGMCGFLYGPKSFRESDLDLVRDSNLNAILSELVSDMEIQYKIYGDGVFNILSHCIGKHHGPNLTPDQTEDNRIMPKVRICNEWDYGNTAMLFPFVRFKLSNKILTSKLVSNYYFVATLLRNFHTCCYSNVTGSYYNLAAPTLEEYCHFLI